MFNLKNIFAIWYGVNGGNDLTETKSIFQQIKLNFIFKSITILLSLIIVPITIQYLGADGYGLWATVLSIISWMNYFDIGIGNGLRNKLTESISKSDLKVAREYIATSYVSILFLGSGIAIISIFIFSYLDWNEILNTNLYDSKELLFFMIVNLSFIAMNFVFKLIKSILYALQLPSNVALMQVLNQIFLFFGVYILSKYDSISSLLGISLIYGISAILVNVIFTIIVFYKYRELKPNVKDFKFNKINPLINLGLKFLILQLGYLIIFTTDNFMIINFFGPESVTSYSITNKLFSTIIVGFTIIMTPIWSATTKAYTNLNINFILLILKRLMFIEIGVIFFSIFFYLFFDTILVFWLGESAFSYSYLLPLNFLFYTIFMTFGSIYSSILNGMGKLKVQLIVAIIQMIINIPISIFFANYLNYGISGIIIGTNLTLLISVIVLPINLRYNLNLMKRGIKMNVL